MILRSHDIPELKELTEEHRQQVIESIEDKVAWKPLSLAFHMALACLLTFGFRMSYQHFSSLGLSWIAGILVAPMLWATFAVYRIAGLNSFFRPAIQSLCESGLPPETTVPVATRFEKVVVISFVVSVFIVFGSFVLGG